MVPLVQVGIIIVSLLLNLLSRVVLCIYITSTTFRGKYLPHLCITYNIYDFLTTPSAAMLAVSLIALIDVGSLDTKHALHFHGADGETIQQGILI